MVDEATILAAAGATTLVASMTTDAWALLKDRAAKTLGRGDTSRTQSAAEELEQSRALLLEALQSGDQAAAGNIEAQWHRRLVQLLRSEPAFTEELTALTGELTAYSDGNRQLQVSNNTFNGPTAVQVGSHLTQHNRFGS